MFIEFVFDLDCRNTFSLMIIDNHDFKERLYTFTMYGSNCNTNNKNIFLKNISQQVANTVCSVSISSVTKMLIIHYSITYYFKIRAIY